MKTPFSLAIGLLLMILKPASAQNTPYAFPRNEIVPAEELTKNCYSYAQLQYELNDFKQFALPLFPDSNIVNLFRDSLGYFTAPNNWYSAGVCFDPKDSEYSFSSNGLYSLNKYTHFFLDSIYITYLYERKDHDAIDTLIVHVYSKYGLRYGKFVDYFVFATTPFDRLILEAKSDSGVHEFRIPLTSKDSIYSQGKWGRLALSKDLPYFQSAGSELAVTVSFKPGYSYSVGDTLYSDSLLPSKKRNIFCLRAVSNGENRLNEYYNNGLFVDRKQAYSDQFQDSVLQGAFIPSSHFSPSYFPDISFKISYPLGIEQTGIEYNFIYPNPTKDLLRLKEVGNLEQLIEIWNTQGKSVFSETLLPQQLELNIAHLPAGVYTVKGQNREGFWLSKLIKL